jgi:hypothetical protein
MITLLMFTVKCATYTENERYTNTAAGYVPRWPFKFGRTYKEECDLCLEEFLNACRQTNQLENETRALSRSQPSLRAISGDPAVRDKLNSYGDRKLGSASRLAARTYQSVHLLIERLKVRCFFEISSTCDARLV